MHDTQEHPGDFRGQYDIPNTLEVISNEDSAGFRTGKRGDMETIDSVLDELALDRGPAEDSLNAHGVDPSLSSDIRNFSLQLETYLQLRDDAEAVDEYLGSRDLDETAVSRIYMLLNEGIRAETIADDVRSYISTSRDPSWKGASEMLQRKYTPVLGE